jgi:hypothetical protein
MMAAESATGSKAMVGIWKVIWGGFLFIDGLDFSSKYFFATDFTDFKKFVQIREIRG